MAARLRWTPKPCKSQRRRWNDIGERGRQAALGRKPRAVGVDGEEIVKVERTEYIVQRLQALRNYLGVHRKFAQWRRCGCNQPSKCHRQFHCKLRRIYDSTGCLSRYSRNDFGPGPE